MEFVSDSALQDNVNAHRNVLIVSLLLLFFTDFIAFVGFTLTIPIETFVLFFMILIIIKNRDVRYGLLYKNVLLIILSLVLGQLSSMILYGQSLYQCFIAIIPFISPLLLYFLLHIYKTEESFVFKFLVCFSIVFCSIELIQQFSYPDYLFAGRLESEITGTFEMRMGFYRFYLFGINYCLLCTMLVLDKFITQPKNIIINSLLLLICLTSVYLFLARKNIYVTFLCVGIGCVLVRNNLKPYVKFLFVLASLAMFFFLQGSMEELNEQSANELAEDGEDFIRFVSADYFINEMNTSFLYCLFGSGVPGTEGLLFDKIRDLIENYHIYQDDCGIVGYYSRFGLFGVFSQMLIIYKIVQNFKYIDKGLLLFTLLEILISFFDFWGNNCRNLASWAVFMYLIDTNLDKNKQNDYVVK